MNFVYYHYQPKQINQNTTYSGYSERGVEQIIQKWKEEKTALENDLKNKQDSVKALFNDLMKQFNQNQNQATDNQIPVPGLKQAFRSINVSFPNIDSLVDEMDVNHNGYIDMKEFCDAICYQEKWDGVLSQFGSQTKEEHQEDLSTRVFLR